MEAGSQNKAEIFGVFGNKCELGRKPLRLI